MGESCRRIELKDVDLINEQSDKLYFKKMFQYVKLVDQMKTKSKATIFKDSKSRKREIKAIDK